jgi:surface protein
MFFNAKNFDQDIGAWDIGNVTDMGSMFEGAESFNQDIGAWDTGNVANMSSLFKRAYAFNQDIGAWDTGNVTNMSGMFGGLNETNSFNNGGSESIGQWDVSSVTDMANMFRETNSFDQPIGQWDVSSVTDMDGMFLNAKSFNQDIGAWDTGNVTDMSAMFSSAESFDQDIGGWDVSSIGESGFDSFLDSSDLSTENYDALLIGWAQLNLTFGLIFSARGIEYTSAAEPARQSIIDTDNWKINDGGRAEPTAPTDLMAEAVRNSISLSWDANTEPDLAGYRLYRATSSFADTSEAAPVADTLVTGTAFADSGLVGGQKYYYRIVAVDTASYQSGLSDEATATFEDVVPPDVPTGLMAEEAAGETIDLSWAENTEEDLAGYRLYRGVGEAPDTSKAPFVEGLLSETSYTDTSVTRDQTYRYGITAVDTAGNESALSAEASAFLPPEVVEASVIRSFGDASGPADYRLVALPGRADTSVAAPLDGEAGAEWQAYRDDGSQEEFLVRFDGSEDFRFEAGNGFWVTATEELAFEASVPTVDLRGDSAATIGLREGWNVISNPLGKDVAWGEVEAATGTDLQPLWSFGGSFDRADTFASAAEGQAYYFFNEESGPDSLVVPYPGAPGSGQSRPAQVASNQALSEEDASEAPGEARRSLALVASVSDGPASKVTVRLAESEDGEDKVIAPPSRFEKVSLRIRDPQAGSPRTGRLMAAARAPAEGEKGVNFPVRLSSQVEGPVELSIEGLEEAGGSREARLLRPKAGKTYDLRERPVVTVEPEGETVELELAVGTEKYVQQEAEEVLPDEVTLTSYPNPMGRQGTLEYALPEAQEVTLKVYDVLGRQVATLEQGRKEAGRHTVQIETDQLSSGVYFGRLRSGSQTKTQKITVVR